ncbi:hypothetical protein LTR84_004851 [Exophiala bonariae]|uniref:Uncharacterized protein n=1 Tax=Exophiala bonariae TaxID=1690606 RepID=A0AAV9NPQ6_9EURO|nr:hypothetical protein LTR84_004851 [Exophiala bonariae]
MATPQALQALIYEQKLVRLRRERVGLRREEVDLDIRDLEIEKEISSSTNDAHICSESQRLHDGDGTPGVVAVSRLPAGCDIIDLTSDDESQSIKNEQETAEPAKTNAASIKIQIFHDIKDYIADETVTAGSMDDEVERSTTKGKLDSLESDKAKAEAVVSVKDSTMTQVYTPPNSHDDPVKNLTPESSVGVEAEQSKSKDASLTESPTLQTTQSQLTTPDASIAIAEPLQNQVQAVVLTAVVDKNQPYYEERLFREAKYNGKTYGAWTNKKWWIEIGHRLTSNSAKVLTAIHECRADGAQERTPLEFLRRASCMSILRQAGIGGVQKRKGHMILAQDFQRAKDHPILYKLNRNGEPKWTKDPAYRKVLQDMELVLVEGLYWVRGEVPDNYDNLIINAGVPDAAIIEKSKESNLATPPATPKASEESPARNQQHMTLAAPPTKRPNPTYGETDDSEAETEGQNAQPPSSLVPARWRSNLFAAKRPRTDSQPVEPQQRQASPTPHPQLSRLQSSESRIRTSAMFDLLRTSESP